MGAKGTVVVFGGDGFCGWPTSLHLSQTGYDVVIVDNFSRRWIDAELGADWLGGFYCPCHGSRFDMAGRVYKDVPAPTNLPIPPYSFSDDNHILVGQDQSRAA